MFSRNKVLIVVVLLTSILCAALILNYKINVYVLLSNDASIHFNLLTVASIIGGFMFSGLGLLVGVSGNYLVNELERGNFMGTIYNNIISGILFCVFSIIVALTMIFKVFEFSFGIRFFAASIEIITLTDGIACFLVSVFDLKFIINSIRKYNRNIPEQVINDLRQAVKEAKSN